MAQQIIAVVGARLNSSRLPRKHFLPLAGSPLIARLVDRLRLVDGIAEIVLATTADTYNKDLVDWARDYHVRSLAFDGDVNNLMGRVDAVVRQYSATAVLYICGDCPLVEPSTLQKLIDAFHAHPSADTIQFEERLDGKKYVHEGFDLYSRAFWDKMMDASEEAFEKEHVGASFHHTQKVIPDRVIKIVDEGHFAGFKRRLSIDTQSDYLDMQTIYKSWYKENAADTIVDLKWVLEQFTVDSGDATFSGVVKQREVGKVYPKIALICDTGPTIGLGHLSRILVAARALQDYACASVKIFVCGSEIENEELSLMPHRWFVSAKELSEQLIDDKWDAVVVDVKKTEAAFLECLRSSAGNPVRIAIDQPTEQASFYDYMWIPSLYINPEDQTSVGGKCSYGWDTFLLKGWLSKPSVPERGEGKTKKVLVLTGGGDVAGLGKKLPSLLREGLRDGVSIDWIRGPFAEEPEVNGTAVNVINSPPALVEMFKNYDAVLCVFGVSFYECLQAGVPVVVFDAIGAASKPEWALLRKHFPDFVADDLMEAVDKLNQVVALEKLPELEQVSKRLRRGPRNFVEQTMRLIQSSQPIEQI